MVALLAAIVLTGVQTPGITRDSFGVPAIQAVSDLEAFELQGYATAQDRLWQLENSRRVARGRMSEAFGTRFLKSDQEILKLGYSDAELESQLAALGEGTRGAIQAYARGVNRYIEEAKSSGKLPGGYAENGFQPAPWTELDSAAIFVQLGRRFGTGGAGELRNWAVALYLQNQPNAKDRFLDVFDDLLWQNDFRSPTTVQPGDDQVRPRPVFHTASREQTENHLKSLPKMNLLELLPAIQLASAEESKLVAQSVSAPYKVGSYAVVVSGKRSLSGWPMLLSAPQMGHATPSVVHEVSLDAPGIKVSGMAVPGLPGVAIGVSSHMANGLTSGVADTDDIVFYAPDPKVAGKVRYGKTSIPLTEERVFIPVRGGSEETLLRRRTQHGPVILQAKSGEVFVQKMGAWMRELQGLEVLLNWPRMKTPDQLEELTLRNPLSFNLFYATKTDIGYLYTGGVPVRSAGLDPRFPTPASPEVLELGDVPRAQMPRVRNPKSGLLTNWNNKPVAWWSNSDTPVWGRIFRVQSLVDQLTQPKIGVADVERSAWAIARQNENYRFFKPYLPSPTGLQGAEREAAEILAGFDGWKMAGHAGPRLFDAWIDALRTELLAPVTGSFLSESTFRLVGQTSVLLQALEGKTKVRYLGNRTPEEVSRAALAGTIKRLNGDLITGLTPGAITYTGEPPVPYGDRGTFIQIVELGPRVRQRTIAAPGVAESGAHSRDQVPLARAWTYKPRDLKGIHP